MERDHCDCTLAGHGGRAVRMRTLLHEKNADREVHLVVTPDDMHAYLKLEPGPKFSGVSRAALVALLAAAGLTRGLIEPGLELLENLQNSPSPYAGYCEVAAGAPMRRGENGSIEFHVQPAGAQPRYDENDAGTIDFKQLNLIENCFAGQRVASVIPPGPGRDGADLFGRAIPAEPGAPVEVRTGAGVAASANGREFTSQTEGRVVFEGGVLSVSPLLEISRDIDYAVGNIDFVGKVTVRGNLLDGFSINGKRGVTLFGEMGASRISSEGDVKISGGVKGKTAAVITCNNLTAHYIDDATVEAKGDVTATNEIVNSAVKALGAVRVKSGAIIGGEVIGYRGVEADAIGSDLGVATCVMAGLNWTVENTKDEIRARMAELLDRAQSAKALLAPLFADRDLTSRLNAEQKAMLSDLISELREVRQGIAALVEERERLGARNPAGMADQINVRKMLRMGVSVRFSDVAAQVQNTVRGPLSLTQDAKRGVMVTGEWRKLPVPQAVNTQAPEENAPERTEATE